MFSFILILSLRSLTLHSWQNWAKNAECHGKIISPSTKEELRSAIIDAASTHRKVKVIGAGHSSNDIACCDDLLISLNHLNRILSINTEKQQVSVEAGITLEQLNRLIAQQGLALSNLISITELTLGGALSTASHGTGHTGTLSSFIKKIELITADGTLHTLSLQNDPDAFKAACVSLGALGIIYSVTLQCEPLFLVSYHTITMSIDEIAVQYKKLHKQTDFFQFRWKPEQDTVIAEFWNRVPFDTPRSESVRYSFDSLACDKGMPYLTSKNKQSRGPASEIALPIDQLPNAIALLKELIIRWQEKGLSIPYLVGRFVQADRNAFLSPAKENVVFLSITPSDELCHQEFEEQFISWSGRPHWGKKHFLNYEKTYSLYGENFLSFIAVKKRLDPLNTFSNAYIDRIFP